MNKRLPKKINIFILFIIILCLQGCSPKQTIEINDKETAIYIENLSDSEKQEEKLKINRALTKGIDRYLIQPEDRLEVMYHTGSTTESQDYLISVDDELKIEFLDHPEMEGNYVVRPDGKITLPRKGDILAAEGNNSEALTYWKTAQTLGSTRQSLKHKLNQ